MGTIKQLETKIGGLFKSAPPLPESSKKSLVEAWPWIALVFGILQVLSALGLWGIVSAANRAVDIANTYAIYYTGQSVALSSLDKTVIYLGVIILAVSAVLLLKAYPELKKRSIKGWDLLFLSFLVNLLYSVATVFIDGRGIPSLVFGLAASAVGFYLLFQVKDKYKTT